MTNHNPSAGPLSTMPHASPIGHWIEPGRAAAAGANRGYVICATPRTGSYHLCDLLRSTGRLGRPHEYFGAGAMRRLGSPEYPLDLAGQIAATQTDGCTENGVFGVKVFADQFRQHGQQIFERLGNPVPIFLERADVLGQAISLTRAAQTNAFFASEQPVKEPPFDAALIRDYLELILRWNAGWQLHFARHGLRPLHLTYEQLVAAPQDAVDRIGAAVGLTEPARIDPVQLTVAVQRDATSDDWRERFLACAARDAQFAALRSQSAITAQRRVRRVARILGLRRD